MGCQGSKKMVALPSSASSKGDQPVPCDQTNSSGSSFAPQAVKAEWSFRGDDGSWVPLSEAHSSHNEAAYLEDSDRTITVSGYEINLKALTQLNTRTGKLRALRRQGGVAVAPPAGASLNSNDCVNPIVPTLPTVSRGSGWTFKDDRGNWLPFGEADSSRLEESYSANWTGLMSFGEYEINLTQMTQRNVKTGKMRAICRQGGVAPAMAGTQSGAKFAFARQVDGWPTVMLRRSPINGEVFTKILNGTKVCLLGDVQSGYSRVEVVDRSGSTVEGWAKTDNLKIVVVESTSVSEYSKANINQYYEQDGQHLGSGSFGSVSKGRSRPAGKECAIKSIVIGRASPSVRPSHSELMSARERQEQRVSLSQLRQEVELMRALKHPNIICLWDTFETDQQLLLVMELCQGGDLIKYFINQQRLSEADCGKVMMQVFNAVAYMHKVDVCHRDLKPANLLMLTNDSVSTNCVKVCDLGIATPFVAGEILREKCGTAYFIAPEVLAGRYDNSADLWSCGVILFLLLCGYVPFPGANENEVVGLVQRGNYSFRSAEWQLVSDDAQALIRQLLNFKPRERITANDAQGHRWLNSNVSVSLDSALENLRKFS